MNKNKEWFQHWFDTPYYHLLYDHRNEEEAEFFMKKIISFLKLEKNKKILDLPCGKGRHAVFLNSQGFDVVGADLSENSISAAKKFENDTLKFHIQDMRDPIFGKYDVIFNLFTSFGYFDDDRYNIKVLTNFKESLNKNGSVIIDFLNIEKVKQNLIAEDVFEKNEIEFHIKRYVKNGFLIKDIVFNTDGREHNYVEKVQCLDLYQINNFAKQAGLTIKNVFGDYNLNAFDKDKSDRLILILK